MSAMQMTGWAAVYVVGTTFASRSEMRDPAKGGRADALGVRYACMISPCGLLPVRTLWV